MNITKKELILKSRYNWSLTQSAPREEEFFEDKFIFERHDGMQVLSVINKLVEKQGIDFRLPLKIEEMLIFLPEKGLTHLQVKLWLIRNWNSGMVLA